jgi:hypothetical protein
VKLTCVTLLHISKLNNRVQLTIKIMEPHSFDGASHTSWLGVPSASGMARRLLPVAPLMSKSMAQRRTHSLTLPCTRFTLLRLMQGTFLTLSSACPYISGLAICL